LIFGNRRTVGDAHSAFPRPVKELKGEPTLAVNRCAGSETKYAEAAEFHSGSWPRWKLPHKIQYRDEADLDIDRVSTFHLIEDDRARLIKRNKELFADDEIGAGVDAGDGFGAVDDPPQ
jgi:hypothetical protein